MTYYMISSSIITNMNRSKNIKPNSIKGIKDLNITNFLTLAISSSNIFKNQISQIVTALVCICIFFRGNSL